MTQPVLVLEMGNKPRLYRKLPRAEKVPSTGVIKSPVSDSRGVGFRGTWLKLYSLFLSFYKLPAETEMTSIGPYRLVLPLYLAFSLRLSRNN